MDHKHLSSDDLLKCLEELWRFSLPDSYRKSLLYANDEYCRDKLTMFKNQEDGTLLDTFFKLTKGINKNILLIKEIYKDRIPQSTFPIADDVYGNLILLSVKGPDRGKVYFWDHEMEADPAQGETPDYSNLTLIADSFDEFINNLKDESEMEE